MREMGLLRPDPRYPGYLRCVYADECLRECRKRGDSNYKRCNNDNAVCLVEMDEYYPELKQKKMIRKYISELRTALTECERRIKWATDSLNMLATYIQKGDGDDGDA